MTVDEAIDRVDRLKCNAYTLREKREWLAQEDLDRKISRLLERK